MGLVRIFEREDYSPEYGLIVLRATGHLEPADDDLPRRHGDGTEPSGTFAGSGSGWITAQARDDYQAVRLELHDAPPPALDDTFTDVIEMPYVAGAGGPALTRLTAGVPTHTDLDLGETKSFRVRVARRDDTWVLQFWPDPSLKPPIWLARSRPTLGRGNNGWRLELPYRLMQVGDLVGRLARERGEPVTTEQVDQWRHEQGGVPAELGEPLWPDPPRRPTTGHADLDRRNADQRAAALALQARERDRLDAIAAELGVPRVRYRRDALPLLVAAGILVREGPYGYRYGTPEPVYTVLRLRPERVRTLRQADNRSRYDYLAVDVASVLRWAPRMPLETTVADLAHRLLAAEEDLRGALTYAQETGLLHAERDELPAGSDEPLRLTLDPIPVHQPSQPAPRPPEPIVATERRTGGLRRFFTSAFKSPELEEPDLPPFGAPPRAGLLEPNGTLVTWRSGVPVQVAQLGGRDWHEVRPNQALETRHGVLVIGHGKPARLVDPSGQVTAIDEIRHRGVALLGDGRHVAYLHGEHHRRESRYRLTVIDLADGSCETLPWPADREIALLGAYGETVFFLDRPPEADARSERITMRWRPGTDPEPHDHAIGQVDPLTGTVRVSTDGGVAVTRPDGTTVRVPIDTIAQLAPGGERLWTTRAHPPALTLFPIEPGPGVRPRVLWLPDARYELRPIWEDDGHVLFAYQPGHLRREPSPGIRLSLHDGSAERLPAAKARNALIVEPLLF